MKDFQQILSTAFREREMPMALATLVKTRGSTYRKPGARLLVSHDGVTTGVLSGGCLEEEIARHGLEVMAASRPRVVNFDTRKLYGCEGNLEIFIERIEPAGATGNFLTDVSRKIANREICRSRIHYSDPKGRSEMLADKALVVEREGFFVETITLPVRLLLFGSGPEIGPMRFFAAGMGWIVECHEHPDQLPLDFIADSQTAAVVMTHNFGRDSASLDRLLPLGLPYVGLLGPKRRQAEILARLQEFRELDPEWLESFHSPAGLDIGSEAPEEIALSIIGEVAAALSKREGGFLRNRLAPIHSSTVVGKEA